MGGGFGFDSFDYGATAMTPKTTLGNPPKTCPISFTDADRLDREVNRLAGELAELADDILLLLVYVTGDSRLRKVHSKLTAAGKALAATKAPARELWNAAHAAALDQGGTAQ
jgi:hypothetical protein